MFRLLFAEHNYRKQLYEKIFRALLTPSCLKTMFFGVNETFFYCCRNLFFI